jgi:hypothetical protein
MKFSRIAFLAAVALACLSLSVSCTKPGGSKPSPSSLPVPDAIGETSPAAAPAGNAFVIRPDASFWILKDGLLGYADALSLGMEITVKGPAEKHKYKDGELSVVPVALDTGKEGYAIDTQVAEADSLAVVTSDLATIYKEPKDTAVMTVILPKLNIIAVSPAEANPEFYKFKGYHAESMELYATRFVQAADVSTSPEDVNTALLLIAAKSMKKKEQKQKLVSTIVAKYPASAFTSTVQELQIALDPDKLGLAPVGARYKVKGVGILRDIPSIFGSEVKRFAAGDLIDVSDATAERYVVNDATAPWLKVSGPVQGWIFGDAADPAD